MWESLKKQPLVGLALAIAAGYVLAHIALRLMYYIYREFLEDSPFEALVCVVCTGLVVLSIWHYRAKISWPNFKRLWNLFWRYNFYIVMGLTLIVCLLLSAGFEKLWVFVVPLFLWAVLAGAFLAIRNWLFPDTRLP